VPISLSHPICIRTDAKENILHKLPPLHLFSKLTQAYQVLQNIAALSREAQNWGWEGDAIGPVRSSKNTRKRWPTIEITEPIMTEELSEEEDEDLKQQLRELQEENAQLQSSLSKIPLSSPSQLS